MIDKKTAVKDLLKLRLHVLYRLSPGRQLDGFIFRDSWQQYKIASLRLSIGDLKIVVTKFNKYPKGVIDVEVWNFNDIQEIRHKFHMKGRIPHVARVVADYINECEVAA